MTTTAIRQAPNATVELFARFWADPHPEALRGGVTDDVMVYYPGATEPECGPDAYIANVQRYLELVPDLRLEVADYAYNGDDTFVRWVARGTGVNGRFEFTGIDRIRTRDGLVAENYVRYDSATFARLTGG
jgi:hypothetical protein